MRYFDMISGTMLLLLAEKSPITPDFNSIAITFDLTSKAERATIWLPTTPNSFFVLTYNGSVIEAVDSVSS